MNDRVNIKLVALPVEHGGWGFLMVPVVAGLVMAPSGAGVLLMLAALGAFLLHQPLKIALKDRLKGKRFPRTAVAERFALIYAAAAVVALGVVLATVSSRSFLMPLLCAVPLVLVQVWFDAKGKGRELVSELFAALSLGSVASSIVILGGVKVWLACALWFLLSLHAVTAILYVRSRLRLERDEEPRVAAMTATFVLAFATCTWMFVRGVVGVGPGMLFLVMFIRAWWGLSAWRRRVPAKTVGFQEIAYGLMMAIFTALSLRGAV